MAPLQKRKFSQVCLLVGSIILAPVYYHVTAALAASLGLDASIFFLALIGWFAVSLGLVLRL
jgi:hypothetical protein